MRSKGLRYHDAQTRGAVSARMLALRNTLRMTLRWPVQVCRSHLLVSTTRESARSRKEEIKEVTLLIGGRRDPCALWRPGRCSKAPQSGTMRYEAIHTVESIWQQWWLREVLSAGMRSRVIDGFRFMIFSPFRQMPQSTNAL